MKQIENYIGSTSQKMQSLLAAAIFLVERCVPQAERDMPCGVMLSSIVTFLFLLVRAGLEPILQVLFSKIKMNK